MSKKYDEIKRLGGEVLAVTFVSPTQIGQFTRDLALPFPVVADVERAAYRAFALGATGVSGFLGIRVIGRYLGLIFRGWLPRIPAANADVWQLGGDFILDRDGKLIFAHASADATDRPAPEVLLAALRAASGED